MKKVIFIGGTGFSGSTLLDMILANDENGFSLGEINALMQPYRKHHYTERFNIIKHDPVWKSILEGGENFLYQNLFDNFKDIDFFVDSSKDIFWIKKQINILSRAGIDYSNILIYKSPYEFAESMAKRGRNNWSRSWISYHRKYLSLINKYKAISYKQLTSSDSMLKEICSYLEIQYFDKKNEFWNKQHYSFFGNDRTRFHTNLDGQGEAFKTNYNLNVNDNNPHRKVYYKAPDKKFIEQVNIKMSENKLIEIIFNFLQCKKEKDSRSYQKELNVIKMTVFELILRKYSSKIRHKILNT